MIDANLMKALLKRLLILVWLLPAMVGGQTPVVSTMGTDFWVGFMPNLGNATLTLLVSGPRATHGIVNSPLTGFRVEFDVAPGQVTQVSIPAEYSTNQYGLHVSTQDEVSLYASNFVDYTFDVTNVLPTRTLGTDYVLQSFPSSYKNEYCVVATEDNTWLFFPDTVYSGHVDSVLLEHRGSKFTVQTPDDVSGRHLFTRGCSAVAVFTGCLCTTIPDGYYACDHIYEQSIPTRYWGKKFVVTSSEMRTHDIIRITAGAHTTFVNVLGQDVQLAPFETKEYDMVGETCPATYIESNYPVSVFLYLTGSSYGGETGDPSFCIIHPLEQQMREATFATFSTATSTNHFVNVVLDSSSRSGLMLDSAPVSVEAFHAVPLHPEYVYAKLALAHGSHHLRSEYGGFTAQVYGLGFCESYSYALGASVDLINPRVWVNEVPSVAMDSAQRSFCPGDTVHLRAETVNGNTIISWDSGNGDSVTGRTAAFVYTRPGDYQITARFKLWDNCLGEQYQEVSFWIHIHTVREIMQDTMVCGDVCMWRGIEITDTGMYSYVMTEMDSNEMCHPIFTLHVKQYFSAHEPTIDASYNCEEESMTLVARGDGDRYLWWAEPADSMLEEQKENAMVRVDALNEKVYWVYNYYSFDSLCGASTKFVRPEIRPFIAHAAAEPEVVDVEHNSVVLHDLSVGSAGRTWYLDGSVWGSDAAMLVTYPLEMDSVMVVMDAYDAQRCHGRDTLMLRLKKETLWVPNVITPSRADNNRFVVQGLNVHEYAIWIYNREGLLVFQSNDMQESWDGLCHGEEAPTGAYVYTIKYTTRFEPERVLRVTGSVLLLR